MAVLLIRCMDIGSAQYIVRNYSEHEKILLNECFLYLYLPPDWVGQYLETYHNNAAQISNISAHDV